MSSFVDQFPTIVDPTINEIKSTRFGEVVQDINPSYYSSPFLIPGLDIKYSKKPEHFYQDEIERLNDLQDDFGQKEAFDRYRKSTNPFELIGEALITRPNGLSREDLSRGETSIIGTNYYDISAFLKVKGFFINRAALKMANLDYVYRLTSDLFYTPWQKALPAKVGVDREYLDEDQNFVCADIASAPGGFTQYIQWRRPEAKSYMISLVGKGAPAIDPIVEYNPGTEIVLGPNHDGDIFTAYEDFITKVGRDRVDLSMADGFMGFEGAESYTKKELANVRLILVELYMGISVLRTNRHMICKLFSLTTRVMQEVIYLASLCFDYISINKPITSRPGNSELYLILSGKRWNANRILGLMLEVIQEEKTPSSILRDPIPDDLQEYLDRVNLESIGMQMMIGNWILEEKDDVPVFDLNKALYLWALPEYDQGDDMFYRLRYDARAT